jgi:hypothetical protein
MRLCDVHRVLLNLALVSVAAVNCIGATASAAEPSPSTYWKVDEIRPGMRGKGTTVMVGTKLEQFGAEVLGVMRDVSPGRDMILCRLTGCNLEHAGIVQGMSGSPIYIDGKLLGAVAFAWDFAKDPIAGVTPFQQMVEFVRSSDRRIAAESKDVGKQAATWGVLGGTSPVIAGLGTEADGASDVGPVFEAAGPLAGMRQIATPVAASGFTSRALAFLEERFRPIGLAPMAGGAASKTTIQQEGDKPLVPGAPLSIAMVTGAFDLSAIGTVTHVEGDRVYGLGHPMFSLGACEFPMMTGYIHTVYPRASVSMKMGSPLKVVGVLDTDVSTGVAGRVGPKPDMLPLTVRVKTGRYSDPHVYSVQVVREPSLLPSLVLSVLTNAIDTEGNLPEELTARIKATIRLKDREPIELNETLSGPRYTGMLGPAALFTPIASIVNIIVRNPLTKVRIEGIDCEVEIQPGRSVATIESVRLASDRLEAGDTLRAIVTLKPFKGERHSVSLGLDLPAELHEGTYDATLGDAVTSIRRRFRNEPGLMEPRDIDSLLAVLRLQTTPRRTAIYLHVPLPEGGMAVRGQPLPNLPGSARALFSTSRQTSEPPVRSDLIQVTNTPWVVEGALSLKFSVVKDTGLSLK